jgi:hypothetical protein
LRIVLTDCAGFLPAAKDASVLMEICIIIDNAAVAAMALRINCPLPSSEVEVSWGYIRPRNTASPHSFTCIRRGMPVKLTGITHKLATCSQVLTISF